MYEGGTMVPDSPRMRPQSPTSEEEEDIPVPCKGCGQVLEEGKAFELAGNRWHIDCFRCNSCSTLLDSDANLLLLGDGSLICNSCTYSCTACGNKIEDLAILTGDQAFCAGCFRCRNCKRKIENLKYARTSQGIFCMSCHETLMARRKKRTKPPQKTPTIGSNAASPMLSLDKSLPAIPMDPDDGAAMPRSESERPTPTDFSPRPSLQRPPALRSNSSKSNATPDQLSPVGFPVPDSHLRTAPLSHRRLSTGSHNSENSTETSQANGSGLDDSFFIPLVLDEGHGQDPSPLPSTSYSSRFDVPSRPVSRGSTHPQGSRAYERKPADSSYSPQEKSTRSYGAPQDQRQQRSNGGDYPRKSTESDRDRKTTPSNDSRKPDMGAAHSALPSRQDFKLGDVPQDRKKSNGAAKAYNEDSSSTNIEISFSPQSVKSDNSSLPLKFAPRGDSKTNRPVSPASAYKSTSESPSRSTSSETSHGTSGTSEITAAESPERFTNADKSGSSTLARNTVDSGLETLSNKTYTRPATANESSSFSPVSDTHSDNSPSHLPAMRSSGGLGFDEDFNRVFGGGSGSPNLLRKVSNSVRPIGHGRSFSDLASKAASSPKWPRSPTSNTTSYISFNNDSSPTVVADPQESLQLKNELRRSNQRIAELEARLTRTASARELESNIAEKRNTVALLETEREAFLRELTVIKEHLDASKDGKSLNLDELKSGLIRGLTRELEDLKETLRADIQALVAQRDQLIEERDRLVEDVENFGRLREQAIQETTQLNMKNAQLADLNNELTRRIQGQFTKASASKQPGGLGILEGDMHIPEHRELRPGTASGATSAMATPVHEHPSGDGAEVFTATKVTSLKNAPPKKFFWKKGGSAIVKGVGKGLNRMYEGGTQVEHQHLQKNGQDAKFFNTQKRGWMKPKTGNGAGAAPSINDGSPLLFGGDLETRADYENTRIPNVVQKCIQEVEMRGMDMEGIYRKSGGSTQMKEIQAVFERGEDPVFDPTLDICAVTSVLKQYFRNLPNPLITFEVYEDFIATSEVNDETNRVAALKLIIEALPAAHRDVLQFIVFHLARVSARREENLMNTRNLAVVFAPTLLRHTEDEREMTDMHAKNNALQFLIDRNELIFS